MRLVVVFGPPAVGKMTVGRAMCARSAYRLFHNHTIIEPLLEVFDHGTPAFNTLVDEFRVRVMEEAAAAGTDLVATFVWSLDLPGEAETVRRYVEPYLARGGSLAFVELVAGLGVRLERNSTEHRLDHKRSKRDVAWSDDNVRAMERHTMSTGSGPTRADELLAAYPHLRLDNTELTPEQAADRILAWLARPPR